MPHTVQSDLGPAAPVTAAAQSRLRRRLRSGVRYGRFVVQNTLLMTYLRWAPRASTIPGRVTIVTATYNRLQALGEATASVQAQTYSNWEQIIVSDGADERVNRMVADLGDARVRACHTHRLPVMGNYQRNVALRYATGEFVLYLDDDNVIYPGCLEAMVAAFESEKIGYVIAPIHYADIVKKPGPGFRYREIDLLNYMVRRSLVERVGGQCVHAAADFMLIDRIAKLSEGRFIDDIIGHHR